jgi:hypothetical protein
LRIMTAALALSLVLVVVGSAKAGVIEGPVSASTTMGEAFPLSHSFDQSGLSATYVSGITDFATFTASTTHDSEPGNDWVSITTVGQVIFNLGSAQPIGEVAIWNFGGLGGNLSFGISQFTISSCSDAACSSPVVLGTFRPFVTSALNPAQDFSFTSVDAQWFKLDGFSSNGAGALGLGEIAFERAVPSPTSLVLLGVSFAGLAGLSWRRRRSL